MDRDAWFVNSTENFAILFHYISLYILIFYHKRVKLLAMNLAIKEYLSQIGIRGGRKSRRRLSSDDARDMVRVREARRAFKRFQSQCFWSYDPNYVVKFDDIDWVVEQLMKNGGREAWEIGVKLSR